MTNDNLAERIYQRSPAVVSRKIAGEVILVPIRQNVGDLESIFTLNETAALVWDLLDGQAGLAQILAQVLDEYAVDAAQAEQDLLDLLAHLEHIGAVTRR